MAGELEEAASALIAALDDRDVDRMLTAAADGAQGVDELSRRWLRGRDELDAYLRQLTAAVSDVRTELRDAQEQTWGDTGLLTCWLDQDYTLGSEHQHISAPTTMVFRRQDGVWKLALFHSIPLPEHDVSDPGITL
jgi:ketosteroid isomerase-like protein